MARSLRIEFARTAIYHRSGDRLYFLNNHIGTSYATVSRAPKRFEESVRSKA